MSDFFTVIILMAFVSVICATRLHCPFKLAQNSRRNCERSAEFRSYLMSHPEMKNHRPDIDLGTEDSYEKEQLKFCCYETKCLEECGHDLAKLFDNQKAKYIQDEARKLIVNYHGFFKHVDPTEFLHLATADTDSPVVDFWRIRATHLDQDEERINRHQHRLTGS